MAIDAKKLQLAIKEAFKESLQEKDEEMIDEALKEKKDLEEFVDYYWQVAVDDIGENAPVETYVDWFNDHIFDLIKNPEYNEKDLWKIVSRRALDEALYEGLFSRKEVIDDEALYDTAKLTDVAKEIRKLLSIDSLEEIKQSPIYGYYSLRRILDFYGEADRAVRKLVPKAKQWKSLSRDLQYKVHFSEQPDYNAWKILVITKDKKVIPIIGTQDPKHESFTFEIVTDENIKNEIRDNVPEVQKLEEKNYILEELIRFPNEEPETPEEQKTQQDEEIRFSEKSEAAVILKNAIKDNDLLSNNDYFSIFTIGNGTTGVNGKLYPDDDHISNIIYVDTTSQDNLRKAWKKVNQHEDERIRRILYDECLQLKPEDIYTPSAYKTPYVLLGTGYANRVESARYFNSPAEVLKFLGSLASPGRDGFYYLYFIIRVLLRDQNKTNVLLKIFSEEEVELLRSLLPQ